MKKLTIIGVGLIGGAIALDVKKNKLADEVVGVVRRAESIDECKRLGVVDKATLSVNEGVKDADFIVLATSISIMPKIAEEILKNIKKDTVVIDVASVKGDLVKKLEGILGNHYVGTHPMAGSEKRGVSAAREDLYKKATCIITPTSKTEPKALKVVMEFWTRLGARIMVLTPDKHDRVVSLISHLPHITAACLVNSIAGEEEAISCVGPGFKDSTRIASSPPELWQEICEWNKDQILQSIVKHQRELEDVRVHIERSNWDMLLQKLKNAKEIRDKM